MAQWVKGLETQPHYEAPGDPRVEPVSLDDLHQICTKGIKKIDSKVCKTKFSTTFFALQYPNFGTLWFASPPTILSHILEISLAEYTL